MKRVIVAIMLVMACDSTPVPTRLAIEPDAVTIWQDQEAELNAVVYDQNDEVYMDPVMVTWAVNNPIAASVDKGVVTPDGDGEVLVTATVSDHMLTASATVTIQKIHFLEAAAAYITQANQHPTDPIPVLEGRDGLFRLHLAEDLPYAPPAVGIKGMVGSSEVFDVVAIQRHPEFLPTVDQSSLRYSYNADLTGDMIRSGLEIHVTYDPEDDERAIAGEEVIEVDVVKLKTQMQMLVPVSSTHHPSNHSAGWVEVMTNDHHEMATSKYVLPIAGRTIKKHALYETDADLRDGSPNEWIQLLDEIVAMYHAETHQDHYYYGAIKPPGGGIGGIAYLSSPASAGDTNGETLAHETGHSMSLRHAPCGNPLGVDRNFPDRRGSIEYWGWHPDTGRLLNPSRWADFMGYCSPSWAHPYHFKKATRGRQVGFEANEAASQPVLMVWGHVYDGRVRLEPVLHITGQPTRADPASPYLLEGYGERGEVVFTHRVPMFEIDHLDAHGFNVLLPVPPVPVASVTLSGQARIATMTAEGTSPLAMIVDDDTGAVRAIRRNWQGTVPAGMRAIITTGLPENR